MKKTKVTWRDYQKIRKIVNQFNATVFVHFIIEMVTINKRARKYISFNHHTHTHT